MRSEVIKIKCDRCGKDITFSGTFAKILQPKYRRFIIFPDYTCKHPLSHDLDLCENCYENFQKFMKSKGVYRG